jgi:hypothetical protein
MSWHDVLLKEDAFKAAGSAHVMSSQEAPLPMKTPSRLHVRSDGVPW